MYKNILIFIFLYGFYNKQNIFSLAISIVIKLSQTLRTEILEHFSTRNIVFI